jgi:hypothetical protein
MQFFGMLGHPHNQILATITVTPNAAAEDGSASSSLRPNTLISEMVFTPGYQPEEPIDAANIAGSETIVFSMGANRDQVPFPAQYYVNGKPFDADRLDLLALTTTLFSRRSWILTRPSSGGIRWSWCRPVVGPAFGPSSTRITPERRSFIVFFLAHEDTGMMATLFIGPQDYHFQWNDHEQLLLGIVVGALVSSVLLLGWAFGSKTSRYAPLVMNELKSKAQD